MIIVAVSTYRQNHSAVGFMLTFADVLLPRRLDWAFAGTSSSELKSTTDGSKIVHSTWHHWIDSRTGNPESIVDEGNMFAQTDGTTLEKGRMVNPATGKMTDYEECWRDVEALSTEASPAAGEKEGLGNGGKRVCTVLQLHDDTNKARGMVIRIGQFVQGVLRVGEAFALERWEWEKKEGWKRSVRIGDLFVPCGVLLGGERVKLGGEVRYGDFGWRVVETSEF